ncbi:putative PHD type zinc finger protein with BAH domain-containing protein [Coemansia thaxteri]|nr:putative PHD type zinc finger protein with BAH domain-containing protein [Coemansia thaxteri]
MAAFAVAAGAATVEKKYYVYLQPEYSEEPFYIGRVMEFVYVSRVRQPRPSLSMAAHQKSATDVHSRGRGAASVPHSAAGGDSDPDAQLRARLAWFQRPRDLPVARVRAKDSRLLVATMHSDINPVTAIKGKCQVRHSSEIADLSAWKAKPDHYYYAQLFDRYSTRLYDIIPVSHIRNAPQDVLQKLLSTYEFIFAESMKITDLTNTRRACTICAKWCSINESLKCSLCERNYHMQCLDPPLSRKPAKGYSWQCAACLRHIQEQKQQSQKPKASIGDSAAPPSLSAIAAGDLGDRKRLTRNGGADDHSISLRSAANAAGHSLSASIGAGSTTSAAASDTESRSGSKRLKLSHGDSRLYSDGAATPIPRPKNRGLWPFRYFGVNTNIEDVLHDDERIYPRAVSRIGPKYQAILPEMTAPSGPELDRQLVGRFAALQLPAIAEKANGKARTSRDANTGAFGASVGISQAHGTRGKDGANGRWHGKNAEQLDRMWDEIEVRRGNHDDQLFFKQPTYLPEDELDMYMQSILPFLRRHFERVQDFTLLDCQDAALHGLVLHNFDVEEALISIPECPEGYIRRRESNDNWSRGDVAKFDDCLREYGSNLKAIHGAIPGLSSRAITLHYYLTRPTEQGKHLLEIYDNRSHVGQRRPNLGQGESAGNIHLEVSSDIGQSSANTPASSPRISGVVTRDHSRQTTDSIDSRAPPPRCLNCQVERASRWYDAPVELTVYNTRSARASTARRLICGNCRDYWFHYAAMPDQDAIGARKQQQQPRNGYSPIDQQDSINEMSPVGLSSSRSASSTGMVPPLQGAPEKSKRSTPQSKLPMVVAPPRQIASKTWPSVPCDVCKLPTKNSDHVVLTCRGCGLCVHHACSGYPERARINLKRWRCGVCENVSSPTISINYACILCRKEPPAAAGDQPRQLMWRTSGNNWAHALCALAVPETRLTFDHGHVVVTGLQDIPKETWERACLACQNVKGAVVGCAEAGCHDGTHASCAIASSGMPATSSASQAVLVALAQTNDDRLHALKNVADFISKGKSLTLAVKCPRHAAASKALAIDIGAADEARCPVVSAVVASKVVLVSAPECPMD